MAVLAAGTMLALSSTLMAADTNAPAAKDNGTNAGTAGGPPGFRGRGGMMGQNIDQRVDQIAKDLNLTDDQKAKLKTAMQDRQQKMMQLFQDNSLSRDDRMAKRKTITEDFDKALKDAGLTQDQVDKISQMGGGRMRGQRGGGQGGQGGGAQGGGDNGGDKAGADKGGDKAQE